MNTVLEFLQKCGTFYLATMDGNQPRVRPFGAVSVFEGQLYICTNRTKKVAHQLKEHPQYEISGTIKDEWIRITGKAILDERKEAKQAMLEQNPFLCDMYGAEDGIFEVYALTESTATIESFRGRNDSYSL